VLALLSVLTERSAVPGSSASACAVKLTIVSAETDLLAARLKFSFAEHMTLLYLDFEFSEDAEGLATLDAMASGVGAQVTAIHAEVVTVLAWAHAAFAGQRNPIDEGGMWDFNLEGQQEYTAFQTLDFDERSGRLSAQPHRAGEPRHTITLSLVGTPEFVAAFRERFGLA
jgi:hypothetical protein